MWRTVVSTLAGIPVVMVPAAAVAENGCSQSADRAERLACYDRLSQCRRTDDRWTRLACYDRQDGRPAPTSEAPALEPAAAGRRPPEAPARGAGRSESGARDAQPTPARTPRADPAPPAPRIVEVIIDHRGRARLTLDNGQVWQVLSDSRYHFRTGTEVEISAGIFGSTNLQTADMDGHLKVRRLD